MGNEGFTVTEAIRICEWYEKNKRSFPWRDTGNPYDVWLSEIMLQQTRIEVVRRRFLQFKEELPDVQAVSQCEDDRLMRLWEGMGYYSRARNLKKCAQALMKDYNGEFPRDETLLKKLPGIGPYTAGAIASICFDLAVPAVDGNVLRVVHRLLAIPDDVRDPSSVKNVQNMLRPVLADEKIKAGTLSQALMELGEVICLPNGSPLCEQCPWRDSCRAHLENLTDRIPFRSANKKRTVQERTVLVIRDGSRFLMNKRGESGLLAGLYEFYGIEAFLDEKKALEEVRMLGLSPLRIRALPDSKHIFTHREWHMKAFEIMVEDASGFHGDSLFLVTKKELESLAVPSAFRVYTDWYALRGESF
ncbi:MAG: A/G-specific adenine glycosylase [Solobacterium sp.]|nr:A/G-specific adenine glycosylase [Solobacterium sp.]